MITRQIGKLLRGSATPFQIIAACLIASFIAFIPGFGIAPGLMIAWIAVLVIVNANLFLAGVVGLVAKLAALALAPVSFALGRWLLDSPLRGGFETLVNAPVFAWFGFEYPLVTGGQFLALVFGLATGLLVVRLTRLTWRRLAALEQDSAAFQRWHAKKWVRFTSFIFVGGLKGEQSYEQLAARRIGNPVRVLGVVLVLLLGVLGFIAAKFFDDAIVTAALRSGLERANGATVDLEHASLEPGAGSLTLTNLALCDPDNVTHNLFAARTVEAKLSTSELLRKRATIDLVTVIAGTHGEKRAVPGVRLAPPPEDDSGFKIELPDIQTVEDIFRNAPIWKERLATVRRWLEKFSGSDTEELPPGDTGPGYEEILRERIRRYGYASIREDSLIQLAPTLLIRRLEAGEVKSTALPGELLTIVAENLSTQPGITNATPSVSVRTASGIFGVKLALEPMVSAATQAHVEFHWKGLPLDELVAQIKTDSGTPPVQGGTVEISANGAIGLVDSNLPLTLTLRDTQLSFGGSGPQPVAELPLSVAVRGPIDQPAIQIDPNAWKNALASVAKGEAKRRLLGELDKALGGGEATPEAGDKKDTARGVLEGLLGGQKRKDAGEPAEPKPAP